MSIHPDLSILVNRLKEAGLSTKRFMKLYDNKKAFESKWEDNPHDVEDLPSYPRWGVAGREGLVLIDSDIEAMAKIIGNILPTTFETISPRRQLPHRFYSVYGGEVQNKHLYMINSPETCGEIRSQNQYVVCPGSEIRYKDLVTNEDKTGVYKILNDRPIARIEYTVFMRIITPYLVGVTDESQKITQEDMRVGVEKGERHTKGAKFAGFLVGALGLSYDEVLKQLTDWNLKNRPPMEDKEIKRLVKYATTHIKKPLEKPVVADKKVESFTPERYFTEKDGKPVFQYGLMLKDIISKFKIITFNDTDDSWLYYPELGFYQETAIPTVKKFMMQRLGDYFKKSYSEEIIYQLKIETYVTREDVEPPPELLNLTNGVLNIKTRALSAPSPEYFFINRSPTKYDPLATRPYFDKLLETIGCTRMKAIQEFCGSLLLASPRYKKALFIYGPTDSLKSTFTNAIVNVLGQDVTCEIAIQHLDSRFQSQRLYKKAVNLCGDLGGEAFSKVSMFKRTVGGDIIESEVKGSNKFLRFIWAGKHWFDANDLPKAEGDADTDAFYNRLIMAAFSKQLPKEQIDKSYPDKLALETSGILNWMLEGLDRLQDNDDFSDSMSIEEIKEHYKRASDSVYCFAKDRCRITQDAYTPKMESHRLYVEYCIEQEFSPLGRATFYEQLQMKLLGIKTDRKEVGTEKPQVWMNLTILKGPEIPKIPESQHIPPQLTTPTTPPNNESERPPRGHSEKVVFPVLLVTDEDNNAVPITLHPDTRGPGSGVIDTSILILQAEEGSVGIDFFNQQIMKLGLEPNKVRYILKDDPRFIFTPLSISFRDSDTSDTPEYREPVDPGLEPDEDEEAG